jgi:CRISPR-associated protein Cas2
MREYVVCYDISSPHRLGRVHRYFSGHAVPIQYSVFLFSGDAQKFHYCLEAAALLIDPKEDDLRAYPLPARGLKLHLGRPALPEGILWRGQRSLW